MLFCHEHALPTQKCSNESYVIVNQKYWPNRFPLGQAKLMPWSCMFLPICLRGPCSKLKKKNHVIRLVLPHATKLRVMAL